MIYQKIAVIVFTSFFVFSSVHAQEILDMNFDNFNRNEIQSSIEMQKKVTSHYVEGEILVKFNDQKLNLIEGEGFVKRKTLDLLKGVDEKKVINGSNVIIYEIQSDKSVEEVMNDLEEDSTVEYAQPNYVYQSLAVTADEAGFATQWGLNNTGQRSGGVAGTADADIDAIEAWATVDGQSNDVVVAVIDSGVAYNHPDLAANMWDGSTCVDPSNQEVVGGCVYGYDTFNDDNDPKPETLNEASHGTHVAGIIGAADNDLGVLGVNPHAQIMAVKSAGMISGLGYGSTTASVIEAINFAGYNGADIMNLSLGYGTNDSALADAVGAFPGLAVIAAGNDGENNDVTPMYPASFTNENIISVAATDQDDNLATFSNYGAVSVDVGAPGVGIYSTVSDKADFFEDVQTAVVPGLPLVNTFNTIGNFGTKDIGSGENVFVTDVNQSPYTAEHTSALYSPAIDLSGYSSSDAVYVDFLLYCDTPFDTAALTDGTFVGFSANGTNYDPALFDNDGDGVGESDISFNEYIVAQLAGYSGENMNGGYWGQVTSRYPIAEEYRTSSFKFLFGWVSNDENNDYEGCYFDNILIRGASGENGDAYNFSQGTSMAAPHVAGLAALLLSADPSLTITELKDIILDTGDALPALDGKTVTGKRINAAAAVATLTPEMHHFSVTGESTQQAGNDQEVTITAVDSRGQVFEDYDGDHDIVFSGAENAPDGTVPQCDDVDFDTELTLEFVDGIATCDMTLFKRGDAEVDVSDSTYDSMDSEDYDLNVTVSAANVSAVDTSISVTPDPAYIGGDVDIMVTAKDQYRNQLAGGGDTVTLLVFNGTSEEPVSATDQNNGTYTATYSVANPVDHIVTGEINSADIGSDGDGSDDGTYNLEVIPPVMDHFRVTGDDVQQAGVSQTITVTATNSIGEVQSDYTNEHAVTFSGASTAPGGTEPRNNSDIFGVSTVLEFTDGVATSEMVLYAKENAEIDVTDDTYDSEGDDGHDLDVMVLAADAHSDYTTLSVSPDPTYQEKNTTVTVTAKDEYQNQLSSGGDAVAVEVSGANTATPSVVDGDDGTYTAVYIPENIGTDYIIATINDFRVGNDVDEEPSFKYELEVKEEQVDDGDEGDDKDDVKSDEIEVEKPSMKISDKIKRTLEKNKKVYVPEDKIKFKGEAPGLEGGTVEIKGKRGSKSEKEEAKIEKDGKWDEKMEFDKDGTWTLKFSFFDKDGKKVDSIGSYKVKIDTEDPEFTNLPDFLNKSRGDIVWFEAKDSERFKKFKVYFNGRAQTVTPEGNLDDGNIVKGTYNIPADIAPGRYEMTVKAYDKAGNSVKKNVQLNIR